MKQEPHDKPALDPISKAKALTPHWMMEIHAFDGLEMHPVQVLTNEQDGSSHCEQCEPDEAHFWSVYGHLRAGGVLCFEDFATEAQARGFAQRLLDAWPHLHTFGLLG